MPFLDKKNLPHLGGNRRLLFSFGRGKGKAERKGTSSLPLSLAKEGERKGYCHGEGRGGPPLPHAFHG